ncbi:3-deoxy-7-phosphoheptulonate synthase [Acinetobacter larvae]|uniref:Phospho-2-dehydro-3-deoxyheptonate aldolase n=1 Tax=Acinetobacter larvae TaxID=1789224 RepID=A0A1B2LZJ0_9GAMM|nr:3-deoxy-7-phosphoheptulonate synthase [Acinetobacter larvae]AOA58356.1 3-deoxy-7-phosphoheptulonate synthase [Acinetobacter larvae]
MNAIQHLLTKQTKEVQLSSPQQLKTQLPLTAIQQQHIAQQRHHIHQILTGKDHRLLVIVGPCSVHDPIAVLEYAERLKQLQSQVADQMLLVMRAYIEKPRTTVGWKGFLYDPDLDGSANLQHGLSRSRQLYLQLIELGLPLATEVLNPMATAYFDDLIAWGAIGARTSESQIHREIASLMPYSIGFKNGTDGSVQIALDAIQSASNSHHFLGMSQNGLPSILTSVGNPAAHLILRGANHGTNYDAHSIAQLKQQHQGQLPALVIDCSHGNSGKDPLKQPQILAQIIAERHLTQVKGVMLESHLVDGQQKISDQMCYGQSITDGCLGWEKTATLLTEMSALLAQQDHHKLSILG